MLVKTDLKQLYEIDEFQWLEETIKLLKDNRLDDIDLENLIEELEDLSRRDKATVESFLIHIIEHLLLYQYWEVERQRNGNHWKREIYNFRFQIDSLITTNLKKHLTSEFDILYRKGKKLAESKSGLILPLKSPYSFEQLLDEDWLP